MAIAVANVVAFGMVGMLAYPHVAARLFPPDDSQAPSEREPPKKKRVVEILGLGCHMEPFDE